jgi:outer membrane protein assembly factor BamA
MKRMYLLAGLCALLCAVTPLHSKVLPSLTSVTSPARIERSSALPTDAELEAAQAVIGTIHFDALDLFETSRPEEDVALFRLANRVHIRTRVATVQKQLLFREGEVFQGRLLEESERILRGTRYLLDAHIRPVAFHDGVVDIEVTTQDVWTFNPGVSYGRKGGANTSGFELEELNLLGLGTQLGVGFKSGVDRDSKIIRYRDRHLGTTWWDLDTSYSDNSDGRFGEFSLEYPFYALDAHRAGGLLLRDDRRTDSRYDRGAIVDRYATAAKFASTYGGFSAGLHDGWTRRWSMGFTYDAVAFQPVAAAAGTALLPPDRKLVYPWLSAEWLEDDFRKDRNRDQIDKTEDYTLGWHLRTQAGYASSALGSDRDAIVFNAKLAKGLQLTQRQTLVFESYSSGRLEAGQLAGTISGGALRYYLRQSPQRLFFMTLAADFGSKLDLDQQLLLGGDNGLRGYPLRYQAGDGRWLFTAEQRYFTNWFPFRLFNVGGAAFFDMGRTWGRDPAGTPSLGLLKDIGLGLRLGGNRSAQGNVLHIDLAFPLEGDPSIRKVQFVLETKHRF